MGALGDSFHERKEFIVFSSFSVVLPDIQKDEGNIREIWHDLYQIGLHTVNASKQPLTEKSNKPKLSELL